MNSGINQASMGARRPLILAQGNENPSGESKKKEKENKSDITHSLNNISVLVEVSSFLSTDEILKLRRVSRLFREPAMTSHLKLAPDEMAISLWVDKESELGAAWLERAHVQLPSSITDDQFKTLVNNGSLDLVKHLDLSECKLNKSSFEAISKLTNLEVLTMSEWAHFTGLDWEPLSGLERLVELNLQGCDQLTDGALKLISGFPALTHLNLCFCESMTDEGVKHLANIGSLEVLHLSGNAKCTKACISHLLTFPKLRELHVSGVNFAEEAKERLRSKCKVISLFL